MIIQAANNFSVCMIYNLRKSNEGNNRRRAREAKKNV